MLRIVPLALGAVPVVDRIIVTSGQSLNALSTRVARDVPLLAVGARTAERARSLGFTSVDHARGTALSLVAHLGVARTRERLLLATGQNLGLELAAQLRAQGHRVTRRVVYRTETTGPLDQVSRAMIEREEVEAILFYSAATARAFLDAFGPDRAPLTRIRALALSTPIGEALRCAPFGEIAIAPHAEQDALLDLLGPRPSLSTDQL